MNSNTYQIIKYISLLFLIVINFNIILLKQYSIGEKITIDILNLFLILYFYIYSLFIIKRTVLLKVIVNSYIVSFFVKLLNLIIKIPIIGDFIVFTITVGTSIIYIHFVIANIYLFFDNSIYINFELSIKCLLLGIHLYILKDILKVYKIELKFALLFLKPKVITILVLLLITSIWSIFSNINELKKAEKVYLIDSASLEKEKDNKKLDIKRFNFRL